VLLLWLLKIVLSKENFSEISYMIKISFGKFYLDQRNLNFDFELGRIWGIFWENRENFGEISGVAKFLGKIWGM
jgi:hypothetical protein